jgi:predicted kinase
MTARAADARTPTARGHQVLVLVGGVPGAGKSTLLARVAEDMPDVRVLDTEPYRRAIRAALPPWVPYRAYRAAVHGLHWAVLLAAILRGPDDGHGPLLVHEPATRPARRERLARLAVRRGWRPVLLMVDVERDEALAGQRRRGRVVASFEKHWDRWSAQRPHLVEAAESRRGAGGWERVHVAGRRRAAAVLEEVLGDVREDVREDAAG